VEGPTAGGHNAPPRGNAQYNEKGEPLYGPKDAVDPAAIQKLGLPFWLAGSYGAPEKLKEALERGAAGVQVGTLFAYCEESGLTDELKQDVFERVLEDRAEVFTDPVASPTGFPFKVVQLEGTQSEKSVYESRPRLCDLGYLRSLFKRKDGSMGYRCPGEPVETYLQKEGKIEDTPGRKCLCNGLMANIGLAQTQKDGRVEKALLTSGDELSKIARFIKVDKLSYTAEEVIQYLLASLPVGFFPQWT
jgi:nitronate monooxygenase